MDARKRTRGPAATPELAPGALIDNMEVCRRLGINPSTWRGRVARGEAPLPHAVMGRRTYYREADVRHYQVRGTWPARMKFRGQPVQDGAA